MVGLAVQFVPLPEGAGGTDLAVRTAVLTFSYALLVLFAALNIRASGMLLILIGLALNLAVVSANGGMPVSAQALRDSGQPATSSSSNVRAPTSTTCRPMTTCSRRSATSSRSRRRWRRRSASATYSSTWG